MPTKCKFLWNFNPLELTEQDILHFNNNNIHWYNWKDMEQISFVYMTTTKTFQQRKKKKKINSRCWKNNLAENIFQTKKKYMIIILQFLRLPHDTSSADRDSDFNLTNSFATSSFVLCERMRKIVQPVSSRWTLLPRWHQHAQLPFSTMSRNCNTATPISRSSRAKQ